MFNLPVKCPAVKILYHCCVFFCLLLSLVTNADAQKFVANYDESAIPEFQLPDPLITEAGQTVSDAEAWNTRRRPELVALFEKHVYGIAPEPCPIRAVEVSRQESAVSEKAVRREVDVFFGDGEDAPAMRLMIYVPKDAKGPVPAFMGLNFSGNHTVEADPDISLPNQWVRDRRNDTTNGNKATDAGRGTAAGRWPVEMIVERGYALVTIYYGDIDPDFDDGFQNGIHPIFAEQMKTVEPDHRWGSISAWSYGLSRALDFLETDDAIDAKRVSVIGHSRLGKTSLWAGASDPRFALVISNNSGCGGAALSRRAIGETIGRINTVFPHWFCDQYTKYNENENAAPVDQHQLIALIAPRPVYVASASGDRWADPKGEFLAAKYADPVYRLLGTNGFGENGPPDAQPVADQPVSSGVIGYHLRTGRHDIQSYDWQQYLDFADRHLKD